MPSQIISAMQDDDVARVLKQIYKRAATDPEFRELIKDDPQTAFTAFDYNTNWNVQFVEPTDEADDVLTLPRKVDVAESLSEEDLEAVAGGADQLRISGCCCNTCITNSD